MSAGGDIPSERRFANTARKSPDPDGGKGPYDVTGSRTARGLEGGSQTGREERGAQQPATTTLSFPKSFVHGLHSL